MRQLSGHALGHIAIENGALRAAEDERRRRDGLEERPPVDVTRRAAGLDARMPLPHERPVGALAQARRDDPAIVVDAGIRVAAIEVLRGLLDAVPGVRFGRAGRRRGGALADLGPDVDDHELLDELGALGREVDRVASAHRQADEDERFETEGLDDAADVVERDGRVVDVGRIAVAVSALVEGEDVKMRLQRDAERVPGVRVPREAVQEEQRRSSLAAPVEQMQLETLDGERAIDRAQEVHAHLIARFGPRIKAGGGRGGPGRRMDRSAARNSWS